MDELLACEAAQLNGTELGKSCWWLVGWRAASGPTKYDDS